MCCMFGIFGFEFNLDICSSYYVDWLFSIRRIFDLAHPVDRDLGLLAHTSNKGDVTTLIGINASDP